MRAHAFDNVCRTPRAPAPGQHKGTTMKITTLGRGSIGGTLGRLWTNAGHDVTMLGQDGGDASDADVVLIAVPSAAVPDALTRVTGLQGKIVLDATNRM